MMRDVTAAVDNESGGKQLPWMHASVKGRFFFTPVDLLEDLAGSKEELERLRKLRDEQAASEAELKSRQDKHNAEYAKRKQRLGHLADRDEVPRRYHQRGNGHRDRQDDRQEQDIRCEKQQERRDEGVPVSPGRMMLHYCAFSSSTLRRTSAPLQR